MKQAGVKITSNEQVAAHAYRMTLAAPGIAKTARPGQFIMVKTADGCQPLLRRPFGVHNVKGPGVDILYEIIGEGTKLLSQKKPGERLDIIGPLGNGFDIGRRTSDIILVAGGIGVAPLVFLAEKLKKQKTLVSLGAKTKSRILCEKEFKALGCEVKIATDDGSKGHKGFVTDLIADVRRPQFIFACGPKPMLKAVAAIARQHNISAQASLEEHMACGIGACLGCVAETKSGMRRVCKDGPVFDAKEIVWGD